MPLYEYHCPNCGRFEVIRKFSDPPLAVCPTCGSDIQKLLSAPAIQFKGTGWYITDYARKSSGGGKAEGKSAGSDGGGSKDSGSKDSGSSTGKDSGSSTGKDAGSSTGKDAGSGSGKGSSGSSSS